jgi:hypothetical protein
MSDVPLGREELLELAAEFREVGSTDAAERIEAIVFNRLFRKITKDRSPVKSVQMNAQLAWRIVHIHRRYPEKSTQEIAEMVGVNPGRVSEAIAGKW